MQNIPNIHGDTEDTLGYIGYCFISIKASHKEKSKQYQANPHKSTEMENKKRDCNSIFMTKLCKQNDLACKSFSDTTKEQKKLCAGNAAKDLELLWLCSFGIDSI